MAMVLFSGYYDTVENPVYEKPNMKPERDEFSIIFFELLNIDELVKSFFYTASRQPVRKEVFYGRSET